MHTLPVLPPSPNDAKAWVETAGRQNLNLLASNYAVTFFILRHGIQGRRVAGLALLEGFFGGCWTL